MKVSSLLIQIYQFNYKFLCQMHLKGHLNDSRFTLRATVVTRCSSYLAGVSGCFFYIHVVVLYLQKMDEKTKNFLQSLGLESLIDHFKQQCIDWNTLLYLNENELKELVGVLGHRLKIKQEIQNLKSEKECGSGVSTENSFSAASTIIIDTEELFAEEESKSVETSSTFFDFADSENRQSNHSSHLETSNKINHEEQSSPTKKLKQEFVDGHSLKDFLSKTSKGRTILQSYSLKGSLDNADRRHLVALIVDRLLDSHDTISSSLFKSTAEQIINLFNTETKEAYYFLNKNVSKNARGKLVDRYKNERHYRQKNSLKVKPPTPKPPIDRDQAIENDILWLQNSKEPWSKVVTLWLKTYELRREDCQSDKHLKCILEQWPLFKHQSGYTLVCYQLCSVVLYLLHVLQLFFFCLSMLYILCFCIVFLT